MFSIRSKNFICLIKFLHRIIEYSYVEYSDKLSISQVKIQHFSFLLQIKTIPIPNKLLNIKLLSNSILKYFYQCANPTMAHRITQHTYEVKEEHLHWFIVTQRSLIFSMKSVLVNAIWGQTKVGGEFYIGCKFL